MKSFVASTLLLYTSVYGEETSESSNIQLLPNSCISQEDGVQFLKPMSDDDKPIVSAKCSNEYMMIDYSIDSDWQKYFTSFLKWHYEIGGPNQQHHVNWKEWYLPSDDNTNFIISPDCSTCDEELQSSLRNNNGLESGYYMNANLYGCFVYPRGMPACDFDLGTYECHACITDVSFDLIVQTSFDDPEATDQGACMTWIRGSNDEVDRTFDDCTDQSENGWKPTIGLEGRFCVCTKPSVLQYNEVTDLMISEKKLSLDKQVATREADIEKAKVYAKAKPEDNIVYLTKESFSKGTYRIKEAGTYILQEDVEFNWNPSLNEDNPNEKGAWWPTEDDDEYPGFGSTRDPFFMGYFAGITIECDNVIIDLNGFELKQSLEFFYQQGFFSVIEIESQPFIPGQGVGFFGSDPIFPKNVIIKNGNIGRTSHHCIHGNYNENLLIENIKCYDFSTHGIQLNGFNGVTIKNVEIGPSNTEQYLASEYTHYRFILERMRKISVENPTGTIKLVNREQPVTMLDLTEELELKMNLAYNYVMYNEIYEEGHALYDDFIDAKDIFVNEHGFGYGASQYGLFLSYPGANVLTYHINDKISSDITLDNIYIHDIRHKTKEYVGIRTTLRLFVNSFNAPLHLKYLIGNDIWQELAPTTPDTEKQYWNNNWKYKGNILTDSTIAMSQLTDNWGYLQIMYLLSDELVAWAKGEYYDMNAQILCAVDGMIHATKGAFGLRIDGVDNVNMNNIKVENIIELSHQGYGMCGECTECAFEAKTPYSVGYSGNMAQGICIDYSNDLIMSNINVNGVESKTGRSFGIAIWPGVNGIFKNDINVKNIIAGKSMTLGDYDYTSLPNRAPESCAIRVYDSEMGYDENDTDNDISTMTVSSNNDNGDDDDDDDDDDDSANIVVSCVTGHIGCWDNGIITQFGISYDCDGNLFDENDKNAISKNLNTDSNLPSKNKFTFVYILYCIAAMIAILVIGRVLFSCIANSKMTRQLLFSSEYSPLLEH